MNWSTDDLNSIAREVRELSLRSMHASGAAHPGGSLSVAEILACLYFRVMRPQPGYMPMAPDADVLVLSKGHSCPALYSCLHLLGVMSKKELMRLRKLGSRTQGHPARTWTPGIVTSTGSLGQGVAFSVGLALAFKKQSSSRRVYCVLGDGDLQEGITTESARLAAHWRLDNLVFVCDRNRKTSDAHSIDPVRDAKKEFETLGWWAEGCDGHDVGEIVSVLEFVRDKTTRPFFLEAEAVKGKGVSFMEDDPSGYHGSLCLSQDELDTALEELKND